MTYERREQIFSKDALSINDVMELLGIAKSTSAELIRKIKRKSKTEMLDGKVLTTDYIKYFNIPPERTGRQNFEQN